MKSSKQNLRAVVSSVELLPVLRGSWSHPPVRFHSRDDDYVGSIPIQQLDVVFQPILSLKDDTLFAYEALARCYAPHLTDPEDLFRKASLENGCGRLGRILRGLSLPHCQGRRVFLNVHPDELADRWVVQPEDPLFQHDSEIFLEITESVPLSHFRLVSRTLEEIRAHGHIHLVVDDLGAGYSNLKRIADLEPAIVKLDRGLVSGMDRNDRQRRLVSAVVRMCVDLGAEVVAEGLETFEELQAARDAGVHFGQGYVLGRPAFPPPPVRWPSQR
jgi:EAL domain-containing protein (putative c-di-GMP-specific phosphodiesterase class I)